MTQFISTSMPTLNSQQDIYDLYFNQDDPFSLTITKKPKIIFDHLYSQITYIWIVDDHAVLQLQSEQIEKKTQLKIYFLKTVQRVLEEYRNQKINMILICSNFVLSQVQGILQPMFESQRIKCIICYGNGQIKNESKQKKIDMIFVETEQNAIQQIKKSKQQYATTFFNFLSLSTEIYDSNNLVKTMFAMIKQQTNVKQIMVKFKQLALLCFSNKTNDIVEFFNLYQRAGKLTQYEAIQWYTKQTFLYSFVNKILRISKDPICLYIIQPYFKDLFKAIQNIYQKQKKNPKYKKFICYRGGHLNQKEIQFYTKKIGSFIQNLGFLSTSWSRNVASFFGKNVLFEIEVNESERKIELDYGFVDVVSISSGEYQILFNPLNSFKIINFFFNLKEQRFIMQLKYGELARITAMTIDKLSSQEKSLKIIGENHIKLSKLRTLGEVLIHSDYILEGGIEYCDKLSEINKKTKKQECVQYENLFKSIIFRRKENYAEMEKYYNEKLIFFQQMFACTTANQQKKNTISAHLQSNSSNLTQIQNSIMRLKSKGQIKKQSITEYIMTLDNLALVATKFCQYQKAIEYLKSSLNILRIQIGQNSSQQAKILNNLGLVFGMVGQYQKAVQCLQQSVQINKQKFGDYHPHYITGLNNLAFPFSKLGQYQKTLKYLEKCKFTLRQLFGENHPDYATTLNNLGDAYLNLGQYQKALEYFEMCRKIRRQLFGQNHSTYATTLNNLGYVMSCLGQYQKAVQYLQKSANILRQLFPENHPGDATTLNNLGDAYLNLGQYQKALEYFEMCRKIRRQLFGQNHSTYATTLNNSGYVMSCLGQYQKAVQYLQKSANILRQLLGEGHPQYSITINNLGKTYWRQGLYEKALKHLEKSQKIAKKSLGNDNPQYLAILRNLSVYLIEMGYLQKTEALAKQSGHKELKIGIKKFRQIIDKFSLLNKDQIIMQSQKMSNKIKKLISQQKFEQAIKITKDYLKISKNLKNCNSEILIQKMKKMHYMCLEQVPKQLLIQYQMEKTRKYEEKMNDQQKQNNKNIKKDRIYKNIVSQLYVHFNQEYNQPGSYLQGTIYLESNSVHLYSQIQFLITGQEHVNWSTLLKIEQTTIQTYRSSFILELNQKINGHHEFGFKFLLPRSMPNSFYKNQSCFIKYILKISLKSTIPSINALTCDYLLNIINPSPIANYPSTIEKSYKSLCFGYFPGGEVLISINCQSSFVKNGDVIKIKVKIDNTQCSTDVKEVVIWFKQLVRKVDSKDKKYNQQIIRQYLVFKTKNPILSGQMQEFNITYKIPIDIADYTVIGQILAQYFGLHLQALCGLFKTEQAFLQLVMQNSIQYLKNKKNKIRNDWNPITHKTIFWQKMKPYIYRPYQMINILNNSDKKQKNLIDYRNQMSKINKINRSRFLKMNENFIGDKQTQTIIQQSYTDNPIKND